MPKKILYIIGSLNIGGTERHLVQILPPLKKKGYDLTVYTLTQKGSLASILEEQGIPVKQPFWPMSEKYRFFQRPFLLCTAPFRLTIFLIRNRPDIIHFFLPESYLIGGLCSFLVGYKPFRVMSRRSLNSYQQKHPFLSKLERWLHPKMDAVLGNSKAVITELEQEGVSADKRHLLYNGIEVPRTRNASNIRKEFSIPEDSLVMLHTANLIPYKGHTDLLDALGVIKHDLPPNWRLLCVGQETGHLTRLKTQAESLGISDHVIWTGSRTDLPAFLQTADIGLLPSHEEGFSNAILEYMAAGLPSVVTDVGGNKEAVLDNETGFVVPQKTPGALGDKIKTLALSASLRAKLGQKAQQCFEDRFRLDRCVAQYDVFYKKSG